MNAPPLPAIATDIPARLDRLPWGAFHWLVIAALGISWILDGLEVTLVGSLSPAIAGSLHMSDAQVGLSGSAYVVGAVAGALIFGRLADRFGRRRLFTITLAVYLLATLASGLAWNFAAFAVCRMVTGAGIGGEYAAVNSAIDELIPARRRGWTDLAVNGGWWLGTAAGAAGSLVALSGSIVPPALGWRLAFALGAALSLVVLWLRRFIPESPRWLLIHGRAGEAEAIVGAVEERAWRGRAPPSEPAATLRFSPRPPASWRRIGTILAHRYPDRTFLVLTLMATQAFCYNAVFFTYSLILTRFFAVAPAKVGWFILPFAAGNFAGPLILGPLFDSLGRRIMISATYGLSGALLALTGVLFSAGAFGQGAAGASALTAAWCVIFFFASAGASSAYLTAGEAFPLEIRAAAISLFYAFGSLLGAGGPVLFGALIGGGRRGDLLWGYLLAAGLMLLAAAVAARFAVAAEGKPLEQVAPPLSLDDG